LPQLHNGRHLGDSTCSPLSRNKKVQDQKNKTLRRKLNSGNKKKPFSEKGRQWPRVRSLRQSDLDKIPASTKSRSLVNKMPESFNNPAKKGKAPLQN